MFSFDLMFKPVKKYFDFQGRARRSEYWLFFLFQCVVSIVLNIIQTAGGMVAGLAAGIALIVSIGLIIPSIAVGIRRFHDTNRTGLWLLFYPVVYLLSLIVAIVFNAESLMTLGENLDGTALESGDPEAMMQFFTTLGPVLAWVFIPTFLASLVTFVFHVQEGTKGPNRFGPDPKGGVADVASTFA